jgi:hypothetical protein
MNNIFNFTYLSVGLILTILIINLLFTENEKKYEKLSINYRNISKFPKYFTILTWTSWFGQKVWPINYDKLKCDFSNCILTSDRKLINNSDAIILNWQNIHSYDLPFRYSTKQMWILFSLESPDMLNKYGPNFNDINQVLNQINLTMTYRKNSEIQAIYGEIKKSNNINRKVNYKFKNKIKSIAWFVSNCKTPSKREKYVLDLQKYIDIDIYGSCGKYKCSRRDISHCYLMIERKYKFYLSFENSVLN